MIDHLDVYSLAEPRLSHLAYDVVDKMGINAFYTRTYVDEASDNVSLVMVYISVLFDCHRRTSFGKRRPLQRPCPLAGSGRRPDSHM